MDATEVSVEQVRAEWDAAADGWDRHAHQLATHTRSVRDRMVALLAAAPGDTILDLAAGLGDLSRVVAAEVAPRGRVICSDASPRMLEAARHRASGIENLEFVELDAQQLELDDDLVDGVTCKMGLMLMPDPAAAVGECRRVLRPGGGLVAATWGSLEQNLWIATFGAAMLSNGHAAPTDPTGPGGIFSLSTPETLHELLSSAGFGQVHVEEVDTPLQVPSFEDYWPLCASTSGPLTSILQQLDAGEVETVRSTCREYAAHLRGPDGSYTFPGRALVAVGR